VLGIRLVHSRPGMPAGRGKIERFLCATARSVTSPAQPGGT
jgi:transposase InsO family protein